MVAIGLHTVFNYWITDPTGEERKKKKKQINKITQKKKKKWNKTLKQYEIPR